VIRPLDPVTSKQRAAYGFAFFVLFAALWSWATFGGYVSKTFLANPLTMLQEGWELLTKHGFLFDIGMTIWRVVGGFVLAAIIAVPLGVLMGAYKPIEAFLEPFGLHPAADPVGGHRRTAEAAGHFYRLGLPDCPDGRRDRREYKARPR
jgi:ABC-type Fe3+ transport system permease subunit